MSTLTADIGNTRLKVVVFDNGKPLYIKHYEGFEPKMLEGLYGDFEVEKTVISSVNAGVFDRLTEYLRSGGRGYMVLTHETPLPFGMGYKTPQTLGLDRIAGMVGAYALHGERPLLVIDAGTCVTYDLLADGVFLGGNIAPGLGMRLRAMHMLTSALPEVEADDAVAEIGQSTATAMQAGAFWGLTYEINGYISRYRKRYPGLLTVLTGGDAERIAPHMADGHGLEVQPLLVPIGLNFIANTLSK